MSEPRLYVDASLRSGESLSLPPAPARRLAEVLRVGVGESLRLFNGLGGEFCAVVISIRRGEVLLETGRHLSRECESSLHISLLQGITRSRSMDYTLQKAVELGVQRIVPVYLRYEVVKLSAARLQARMRHWSGVIVAACEQCGRNRIPQLEAPLPLEQALLQEPPGLCLHPRAQQSLAEVPREQDRRLSILCGAEGGFAPRELEAVRAAGWLVISLGPRVLRAETAPVAALSACQLLWGDLAMQAPPGSHDSSPRYID